MIITTPNGSLITLLPEGRLSRFVDTLSGSIQFRKSFIAAFSSAITMPVSVTQVSSLLFFKSVYNASYSCSS